MKNIMPQVLLIAYFAGILTTTAFYVTIVVACFLIVQFPFLFRRGGFVFPHPPSAWWLYALLVTCLLSVTWSQHPDDTSRALLALLPPVLIFVIAAVHYPYDWATRLERTAVAAPFIALAALIAQFAIYGAVRGVGSALSNHAPAIAIPFVPILMGIFLRRRSPVVLAAIGCSIVVTLLSGGRGAYALLAVAIVLPLVMRFRFRSAGRSVGLAVFIAATGTIAILILGPEPTVEFVAERYRDTQLFRSNTLNPEMADYGRSVMYSEGIAAIRSEPIMGIGYGALGSEIERKYGFRLVSHNLIITAWGEAGLLGLISLVGLFSSLAWRVNRTAFPGLLLAIGILFAYGMTRPQLTNPAMYLLFAAAMRAIEMTPPLRGENRREGPRPIAGHKSPGFG